MAKPKEAAVTQLAKFKEAARAAETDDSEEAFDRNLKRIAKAPPPPREKQRSSE